jgi:aminopeptidase-like protein
MSTAREDDGPEAMGAWAHRLMLELFPICRSLAGPGNRSTLDILGRHLDLSRIEIPSGTPAFDWTVPDEWHPESGRLVGPDGHVWADFASNNLHVVNCSEPVDAEFELEDLQPHLYSLPDQPGAIPYVTSYFKRSWGFCLAHAERMRMPPGRYRATINARRVPGSLSIGEAVLPGEVANEVLVSTYICHPSMANDNLSGVVAAAALHRRLAARPRRFTYRFVFLPETIGSIAWLARDPEAIRCRTAAGLVLSCVGDGGGFTYKRSRRGDALVDRVVAATLGPDAQLIDFTPVTGSDERQYCSPGFDLPVGLLSRTYPGRFPQYHTSEDTPDFVTPATLARTMEGLLAIVDGLEACAFRYVRVDPHCEPMLSKRGLYSAISMRKSAGFDRNVDPRTALMWVLNFCDGRHDMADIAWRSGLPIARLAEAAELARAAGVLRTQPAVASR